MTLPRAMFRLILCVALALCSATVFSADESKRKSDDKRSPTTKKSPATKRTAQTHTITIRNSKFSPASLTIKAGDTVTWTNADDKDHTVNADDKSFKSANISPDGEFEQTFNKAGTFKYGCKYHPREKATITVDK